jgi:hypothetical protein
MDLGLYNLDLDYRLSRDELLLMMEDLIEIKFRHWNVPMVTLYGPCWNMHVKGMFMQRFLMIASVQSIFL